MGLYPNIKTAINRLAIMASIGTYGNQGTVKPLSAFGSVLLRFINAIFTIKNNKRNMMTAALATSFICRVIAMIITKRLVIKVATNGVLLVRCIFANIFGKEPSLPIAKETLEEE